MIEGPVMDLMGTMYYPIPEFGAYFGTHGGKLLQVPMLIDGSPALNEEGLLEIVEVVLIEDDCLAAVNQTLGTSFTQAEFFGR